MPDGKGSDSADQTGNSGRSLRSCGCCALRTVEQNGKTMRGGRRGGGVIGKVRYRKKTKRSDAQAGQVSLAFVKNSQRLDIEKLQAAEWAASLESQIARRCLYVGQC